MVIQLGGEDRFKIKKVNPVVDEGYETGEGSNCGGGFRGCAGDEYSEDDSEEGSEQERDSEGSHTDDENASEVETVIDEEGHVSDEGDDEEEEEVRESDMAGQGDGHTPEIVIRISMEAGGQVESN